MGQRLIRGRALLCGALIGCAGALLLAGCAKQPPESLTDNPPGFFMGLLHGFLILFTFIASFFTDHRIYAYPNSGTWYDLGYLLGAMMSLGGGGAGARHKRKER